MLDYGQCEIHSESTHPGQLYKAPHSDVPIIGNNRLIDRKAVDYDDRFSIINNRSSDACTKHVYNKIHMHKAT